MIWTLAVYCAVLVLVVAGMLTASWLLGQRHRQPATGAPYEGGVVGVGSARARFPARFYLLAMFFVVFDLESVFLYTWAIAARDTGWPGYWEALIFAGVLAATLVYLGRTGAFDWMALRAKTRAR